MKTVYLDQNHWIGLARAHHGKDNAHRGALDAATSAAAAGRACFPLSFIHCLELRKIRDKERRRRLAQFMLSLSEGWFLAAWRLLLPAEAHNAVASFYGLGAAQEIQIRAVGRGMIFAAGAYDWASADLGWTYEQAVLVEHLGDTADRLLQVMVDDMELRPLAHQEALSSISASFARRNQRGRPERKELSAAERRILRAAEILHSIQKHVIIAHGRHGREPSELLKAGRDGLLDFIARMPTVQVDLELGLEWERQWSREYAANDLEDFGHLNIAIPYCDVVITENFWTDLAKRAGLPKRYDTAVEAKTDQLIELLS